MYRTEHSAQVTIRYLAGDEETLTLHPSAVDDIVEAVRGGDVVEFETDDGELRVVRGDFLVSVTVPAVRAWWELAIAVNSTEDLIEAGIFDGTEPIQPEPCRNPTLAATFPMAFYFRGVASRKHLDAGPIIDSLQRHGIAYQLANIGENYGARVRSAPVPVPAQA